MNTNYKVNVKVGDPVEFNEIPAGLDSDGLAFYGKVAKISDVGDNTEVSVDVYSRTSNQTVGYLYTVIYFALDGSTWDTEDAGWKREICPYWIGGGEPEVNLMPNNLEDAQAEILLLRKALAELQAKHDKLQSDHETLQHNYDWR